MATLATAAAVFVASYAAFQSACAAEPDRFDVDDSDMMKAAAAMRAAVLSSHDESRLALAVAQYLAIVDGFEEFGPFPMDDTVAEIAAALPAPRAVMGEAPPSPPAYLEFERRFYAAHWYFRINPESPWQPCR